MENQTVFKIKDNNGNEKTYTIDKNRSFHDLKSLIIKDNNLKAEYIDLDFKIEKPIRVLGKFNLEPGILPRTLDNYALNRYGIIGRTINASFIEVDDYKPFNNHIRKKKEVIIDKKTDITFNINSEEDFPSL